MVILKQFERTVIKCVFSVALIFVKWFGSVPLVWIMAFPGSVSQHCSIPITAEFLWVAWLGLRSSQLLGDVCSCVMQMCNQYDF